jgi:hypothetical protein
MNSLTAEFDKDVSSLQVSFVVSLGTLLKSTFKPNEGVLNGRKNKN